MPFQTLTRPSKLNIALWGPSGAGKTYTALGLAHQLGQRVAVADTEHCASALYTDRLPAQIADVQAPYAPEVFIALIDEAESQGFDVLIFDSLSPEWDGPGGCLALLDAAQHQGHKGVRAWKVVTPRHEALLHRINTTPLSIITTLREKPRVLLDTAESNGKNATYNVEPRPVMRERYEFEYDLVFRITMDHRVTAVKSRLTAIPEGSTLKAGKALLDAVRQAHTGSLEPVPSSS